MVIRQVITHSIDDDDDDDDDGDASDLMIMVL